MNSDQLHYAAFKAAAEKGINDIKSNPERGARNLVDLGAFFARNELQKSFFKNAQDELKNPGSPYYNLVSKFSRTYGEEALKTIGINFGYNCLTYGSKIIRKYEKSYEFNIPWTMIITLSQKNRIKKDLMSSLIMDGKTLGIYSFIFIVQDNTDFVDDLISVAKIERDCVFTLIMNSSENYVGQNYSDASNLIISFPLEDLPSMNSLRPKKLGALKENHVVATHFYYNNLDADFESYIAQADEFDIPFLFMISETPYWESKMSIPQDTILSLINKKKYSVLPVDFYQSLIKIDKRISYEACMAQIDDSGEVTVYNAELDKIISNKSVRDNSLFEILSLSV